MRTKKDYPQHPVIQNLRKIMNDKELKQEAVASYAGIDPSQMSKVMKGEVQISLWQLSNIATGLGMELIDLFTYPEKYVPAEKQDENVTAMLTIQLRGEKKEKVLRAVFGDKNLKLLDLE